MKKITLEIARVSKGMRLKYSLILDSQETQKNLKILNQFSFKGNEYVRLNPHPFITIDISGSFDKNEEWSTNKSVNLNLQAKMRLESRMKALLDNFTIRNLFYYNAQGKLTVNQEIDKKLNTPFVLNNKTCVFHYAVIPDEKSTEIEYEGVIFMINTADNFSFLTFEELSVLYYALRNTNMMELTMAVLTYYNTLPQMPDGSEIAVEPNLINEQMEKVPEPNRIPPMEIPSEIPDI